MTTETVDTASPQPTVWMPAEWETHAGCLMQWPCRDDLWGRQLADAKAEYAGVARAIAEFEPVVMICPPAEVDDAVAHCGSDVSVVAIPIDDSWARDSGPIFVRRADGGAAVAGFTFNAWGNRWQPHDSDAALSRRIADWLGLQHIPAPMVLEGGAFFVDGQGTLITTEQCLLNPNRNPTMTQTQIEHSLCAALGVSKVIWLPYGHSLDTGPAGTDGHVDGVLQYVGPARVMLEVVGDPASPEHQRGHANLDVLQHAVDANGRSFEVDIVDPGVDAEVSYANHYLANGAVIVPVARTNTPSSTAVLDRLAEIYPDRRIVGVTASVIADGGGGPHCITQQIPSGIQLPI